MNTYAMRNFLFALVVRASGLDTGQPPELTTVTIRSMIITTTSTVTVPSVLWANTSIQTLPPIEPSTALISNTTGGTLDTGATAATSAIIETSISGTGGSCITVTPNLSVQPSLLPSTSSETTSTSTKGDQTMSSVAIIWPRPGIADPPEAPSSSSSVPQTTSRSPASSSTPDTVGSSTIIGWSISPTISPTGLFGSSTGQNSDSSTSTSSETFTTETSSQVTSVSTVTTPDGTGYGEATMIPTTADLSRPDQSSSNFSPTTPPSTPSPSTTIKVSAINKHFIENFL